MPLSEVQAQIAAALVEQIVADTPDLILKEIEKRNALIEEANNLIIRARERIKSNNELLQQGNNLLPEKLEEAIAEKQGQLKILEKTVKVDQKYGERLKRRVEEMLQKIKELEKNKAKAETTPKSDIIQIKEKINEIERTILEDQKLIKFAQEAINTFEQRTKMLEEQHSSMLKIEQLNQKSSDTSLSAEQQSSVQCRFM
jgi:hypothetical protein